jgi:phenylacetate-CoA ligase
MPLLHKLSDLGACMAFQWLPRAVIEQAKLKRLRRVLELAERHVPFYREKFARSGARARDVQRLDDLRHFPIVTREEVIDAYPDGILSRLPQRDDVVFRTSGTSGQFMEVAYGARANDFLDAVYGRALFNAGYRPWDTMAYYWWEAEPRALRTYERLGFMRKEFLVVHADPERQLADLEALAPDVVYHFPSSMLLIARLLENGARRGRFAPRLVICHGELMTPEQRSYLERMLGCPVFDQYGAQEFNRMGWDCREHRGLHEDSDSVHIEVLCGDRPAALGEEGELVVTGLANDLMPLIRYRIGDAGYMLGNRCPCGRALPLYRVSEGRLDDVLELPDGRRIGPRTLAPRIEQLHGFRQYRVLQTAPASFEVLLIAEREAPSNLENLVADAMRSVIGESNIEVRRVSDIPLSRRGKLRKIVGLSRERAENTPAPRA